MKRYIVTLLALFTAFGIIAARPTTRAEEKPIVTLVSSIYNQYGSTNQFHIVIGGTAGEYVDVDCGFGPVEVELQPATISDGVITGTTITCNVAKDGIVRIYGNPDDIDYFEAEGCYLTNVDISSLTKLQDLNLSHNELRSLDLSPNTSLSTINVSDNPFSASSPLKIGPKPSLVLLEMAMTTWLDQNFNLSDYPKLISFEAFGCETLYHLDPTGCPDLVRISADVTPLSSVDLSKNKQLQILNVSDTRVTNLDLSNNPLLQQLFCSHDSHRYKDFKLKSLDVTKNPKLAYLFAANNEINILDLTQNPELFDLSIANNKLTTLDLSKNEKLYNVDIRNNYIGFADLPQNPGTWSDYFYEQNEIAVNKSFKKGDVIDLSSKMVREGTVTTASLKKKNIDDFLLPIPMPDSVYSYADGKLTVLQEIADSVFISFSNDRFDGATLNTTHFVVKSPEAYGLDNKAISFVPDCAVGKPLKFNIGIGGATPENPKKFTVDFGDGNPVEFSATGSRLSSATLIDQSRAGSGNVIIYTPENEDVYSFSIQDQAISSIDLKGAPLLRELTLKNTELFGIDLATLRCLETIDITGNNLSSFSFKALNVNFNKTALHHLDLSNNKMSTFEFDGLSGINHLNLSHNNLKDIIFDTALQADTIDVSYNQLTEVNLKKCDELKNINLSHNKISDIILPEIGKPEDCDISHNNMTLASMPMTSTFKGKYVYAPQNPITIPSKGPGANLSTQCRTIAGAATTFRWFQTSGKELTRGSDFEESNGKTKFINTGVGNVLCKIEHPAFPMFSIQNQTALSTTEMEVAALPDNVIASFTTPVGDQTVALSFAATTPRVSLFVDWSGDGVELDMYELTDTYRRFEAKTIKDANVKFYTYGEDAPISVFTLTGATLENFDISRLTKASTINLSNAGLSSLSLPESNMLYELILDNNKFTEFDLSKCKNVNVISLNNNLFEGTFDLSANPNLDLASIANNRISAVKLNNPRLWWLNLSGNQLEEIDLSEATGIEELGLSYNKLREINVSKLKNLKALTINNNRFRFSTLPPVSAVPILYNYANQEPISVDGSNGVIDLSSEAIINNTESSIRWFLDEINIDENGNFTGEELVAGEEYDLNSGITSFRDSFSNVMGVITNPDFPNLALFTTKVDITASSSAVVDVETAGQQKIQIKNHTLVIESSTIGKAEIYDLQGKLEKSVQFSEGTTTISDLPRGLRILKIGDKHYKVML